MQIHGWKVTQQKKTEEEKYHFSHTVSDILIDKITAPSLYFRDFQFIIMRNGSKGGIGDD